MERPSILPLVLLLTGLWACQLGPSFPEKGQEPLPIAKHKAIAASLPAWIGELQLWPGSAPFPQNKHLAPCKEDADCGPGVPPDGKRQRCVSLLGQAYCLFPCDPQNASNNGCIAPESCLPLAGLALAHNIASPLIP